ncbi:GntR family transcriptional regulator [Kitasatospora sp. NPDC048286]|uniref:GntR family transcriptional regulator n=1 Tax=Kitasatospora sp. NPDC048286 TaxID=3364047 RepID=UPI003714A9B3
MASFDSSVQRVEDVLHARIVSGRYASGMKFPAERELAAELGVSRMTLRQAVESLQFRGLVKRRPGRAGGTFVSAGAPVLELASMVGLVQQLAAEGIEVASTVLAAESVAASPEVAAGLGLAAGDEVHHLRRLRFADGEAVAIEGAWYPAALLPGFPLGRITGSVYAVLGEYRSTPVRKVEELLPAVVSAEERELLGVGARSPVLRLMRTSYREDGRAIEYAHDVYRADALRVRVTTGSGLGL